MDRYILFYRYKTGSFAKSLFREYPCFQFLTAEKEFPSEKALNGRKNKEDRTNEPTDSVATYRQEAVRSGEETANETKEPSVIDWGQIWKPLSLVIGTFLVLFWLPVINQRFTSSVIGSLALAKWYAREHVLLCLIPAFFIAGAISVFVSQAAVMKYLGAGAKKIMSYGVAFVSGTILAVCSCSVLPLFAENLETGTGLGPAIASLYSDPAINVLAIILTARILGPEIGFARAVGAVFFSIVIGLIMHVLFRKEEEEKALIGKTPAGKVRKVAYFAGCTAIFLFPEVARSTVEFLLMNGVRVHVPKQNCCGMPSF